MSAWHPGIKAFCAHWSHAVMLQQTLETLEREFEDDNDACIDAAKAIVECACRIIIETNDDPAKPLKPARADVPLSELLGLATRALDLGSTRDRAFADLIREHNRLADALRVLRNEGGSVSHGKDGFVKKLSTHHRRAALLAADAIVTFLHESYLERAPDPTRSLEPYDRFEVSNDIIDEFAAVRAGDLEEGVLELFVDLPGGEELPLRVSASRLLFGVDREAYKVALAACIEARSAAATREVS